MTNADLIRAAIAASGLSSRRFAEFVTWRDERTVRRWGAGESIPETARARLIWFLAISSARRRRLIEIITSDVR